MEQGQGTPRARIEEQRLRELIERLRREGQPAPISDDLFFVSGAYPRPLRGRAAADEASAGLRATHRHVTRTFTTERLVVAAAGDLAYEYGTGRQESDTLAGEHRTEDAAYLIVWRQHAGEWRMAAAVFHPISPDN